ncbi:hypothetical protein llap_13503 [Limosa lapponica baueri]|uniref:Uncharacterized protein n=1 Tax=Limosa lapponica baueri TaxID=1758121 RepID=A0A2I0TQY9_LIMLA|nr:hypothetical protein llap_13503 [Limosa lapponica baueri]
MLRDPCILPLGPDPAAKAQVGSDVAKLFMSLPYASICKSISDCGIFFSWEEVDVVSQEEVDVVSQEEVDVVSQEEVDVVSREEVSRSIASPIPSEKAFYFSAPLCESVFVGSRSISSCQGIIRWGA